MASVFAASQRAAAAWPGRRAAAVTKPAVPSELAVVVPAIAVDESSSVGCSAERMKLALRAGGIGLWEWDRSSGVLYWAPELEALCGLGPGEFGGRRDDFIALVHADDRELMVAAREAEEGLFDERFRVVWADGTVRWLEGKGMPLRDEAGEVVGRVGVTYDITVRHEAELEREAAQRQAVEILDSITDAFFAVDRDSRLSYANGPAERLMRRRSDESIGLSVWDVPGMLGSPFEPWYRRVMAGEAVGFEEYWTAGGRWLEVRAHPTPSGMSIYVRDVTERRQLEEQLRHSQKMEALGQLAGGIAHDFNNALQVIMGYASMLVDALEGTPEADHLAGITSASDHAAGLARQLLAFARKQPLQTKTIDLNSFVQDTAERLRRLIGAQVVVTTQLAAPLSSIEADATQIEQILINLALNARDAMPDGGTLTISTANVAVDGWLNSKAAGAGSGTDVCLRVADSGLGIDAATKERLFEPFFTTKGEGRGTGLGLSTVYGIVKQSGGYVTVDSEPGAGTAFSIYLPGVSGVR